MHVVIDDVSDKGHLKPATVRPSQRTKVATGKIGDRAALYDEAAMRNWRYAATQLKFSTGDEFDKPQHGLFMGAT